MNLTMEDAVMLTAVEYIVQADENGNVQFKVPVEFANVQLRVRVVADLPRKTDGADSKAKKRPASTVETDGK